MKQTKSQQPFFYVYITVNPSDDFKRDEWDLFSETDVSVAQVLLGGVTPVKGLHHDVLGLEVPPLTSSHTSLCIRNEGIVRSDGEHKGNHYVRLGIVPPQNPTERQIDIWKKLAQMESHEFCMTREPLITATNGPKSASVDTHVCATKSGFYKNGRYFHGI